VGITVLRQILQLLLDAGFNADVAYPGQRYPVVTRPMVTVHISEVDSVQYTVTMEVTVHCPASLGGAVCEEEALRVLESLAGAGAECTQKSCQYDGIAKVYSVSILALFRQIVEVGKPVLEFRVKIGDLVMTRAVAFSAEQKLDHRLVYSMGESAAEICPGSGVWEITLEEWYLPGMVEGPGNSEPFTLSFDSEIRKETYSGCRWVEQKRQFASDGLHLVRKGIALSREVS
jgi:hypothetical protein